MTKGHQCVMPYFLVDDAGAFMTFLTNALSAEDRLCMRDEEGGVMHAEMTIGESVLMLGQASKQWTPRSSACYVYVHDTDATHKGCIAQGCKEVMAPREEAYGVRSSGVMDPWGNTWWLAQMH